MKNVQIQETAGQTTAGLTSASQLVNITDAASYRLASTSSAVPEQVAVVAEPSPTVIPECVTPVASFRDALHSSMRHQAKILDILAKL